MIAHIKGRVDFISDGYFIIESYGVGYGIYVSASTLSPLNINDEIKIYTHTLVREDGVTLYGFLSKDEIDTFGLLLTVTGVGPKAALGLLNIMRPKEVTIAILAEDYDAFVKVPGIGKKTAQMIVLKLKDKIKAEDADTVLAAQVSLSDDAGAKKDSIDALTALGYGRSESLRAVLEVALPDMKTEQIIKLALKKLSRQGGASG